MVTYNLKAKRNECNGCCVRDVIKETAFSQITFVRHYTGEKKCQKILSNSEYTYLQYVSPIQFVLCLILLLFPQLAIQCPNDYFAKLPL
jgi:hypothetical protein